MIIIDGPDATGKSYLAKAISRATNWPIQPSEGPEKAPGEILARCEKYLRLSDFTIFDRHPIISQSIYGPLARKTAIPPYLLIALKQKDPLIIQAHPENHFPHEEKEHDTPEHLQMIAKQREIIVDHYNQFFILYFPSRLVYRPQFIESIVNSAAAYARRRMENVKTKIS